MDNTTGLAAQMAYQFLFTLAPGLLFLWHLLGLFGTDPAKLHQMLTILKSFLPSDPQVQAILDTQAANVVVTGSSGWVRDSSTVHPLSTRIPAVLPWACGTMPRKMSLPSSNRPS
jgi:hypothetical protein